MPNPLISSRDVADFLKAPHAGKEINVVSLCPLKKSFPGGVTFVTTNTKDPDLLTGLSPDALLICPEGLEVPERITHIRVKNAKLAFVKVSSHFFPENPRSGIEETARVSPQAVLGNNVYVGHNVVIEEGSVVGDNTVILHGAVVSRNVRIGTGCLVKSHAVLGQKGFGFVRDEEGVPIPFPHVGNLVIGDGVEIGAHATIALGALGETRIEDFVKLDDHVHIAHNSTISSGTMVAAGAIVSGSVEVGAQSWIAPNASVRDGLQLHGGVFVGIGSVVISNLTTPVTVAGNPARPIRH